MFRKNRSRVLDGCLVLRSAPSARDLSKIGRLRNVAVDETDPAWGSLEPLRTCADVIERLVVTDYQIRDISVVESMTNLTKLQLFVGQTARSYVMDLAGLTHLADFAGEYQPAMKPLLSSPTLTSLALFQPPADVFSSVPSMPSLTTLDLRDFHSAQNLEWEGMGSLKHLTIAAATLVGMGGLAKLPDLERLELDQVKGLEDLSRVAHCKNLKRLVLEDCGKIPTLTFLASADLDELMLIGTTDVQDGDLTWTRSLKRRIIRRRAHYRM